MIPVGIYRHYKGQEYEVIGTGLFEATEEPCVMYRALYGEGQVWIRPVTSFEEQVNVDGVMVPRFERLSK